MSDTNVQVKASLGRKSNNATKRKTPEKDSIAPSVGFTSNAQDRTEQAKAPTFNADAEETAKNDTDFTDRLPKNVKPYFEKHGHAIVYGLIGLIAAILILIIGFWPVLLLAILTAVGMLIGRYRDGNMQMNAATRSLASIFRR
ncbi:DUF2273 domain-containing protein [Adlercreutzia sp. ZJ154]|uniref:DUF2273 domain-containing protein n=1 Tax=Adlercreutzia sp. ZJ154 TaxID=2709790 RepID=UPI0013ECA0AA|nr:DUF2273 domain-containing protein [Adlercreutzia sp. ZJ154]